MVVLQNLNVLMVGAKDGKGGFFPEGIAGRINTPEGFDALSEGIEDFDGQKEARQVGHLWSLSFAALWRQCKQAIVSLCSQLINAVKQMNLVLLPLGFFALFG